MNQSSIKKTVILGSSPNPMRYAFFAAEKLKAKGFEFIPLGIKDGSVLGEKIQDLRTKPTLKDIDTVTIYLSPSNQVEWEDYILSLKPSRIIFNPGAENPHLMERAQNSGIETLNACTLVMLGNGLY